MSGLPKRYEGCTTKQEVLERSKQLLEERRAQYGAASAGVLSSGFDLGVEYAKAMAGLDADANAVVEVKSDRWATVIRVGEVWIAFYTTEVLANGYEPYDQPKATAYMPFGYGQVDRYHVQGGVILVRAERLQK